MSKMTIPQIVEKSLNEQGGNGKPLPLRVFAEALTAGIPNLSISHQTVAYWLNGEREPGIETLMTLMFKTRPDDWRHALASDLIAVKIAQSAAE